MGSFVQNPKVPTIDAGTSVDHDPQEQKMSSESIKDPHRAVVALPGVFESEDMA